MGFQLYFRDKSCVADRLDMCVVDREGKEGIKDNIQGFDETKLVDKPRKGTACDSESSGEDAILEMLHLRPIINSGEHGNKICLESRRKVTEDKKCRDI